MVQTPLTIVGGLLLIGVIFLLSRCFAAEEEAGYATETVRRGDLTVNISATGNLYPTNQVEVGSEQSGLVTEVYVDNNSRVVRGQPLARLDPARLRDTIVQNQAALAAAQAQVAQAEASRAQASANLARLEEVYRLSGGKVPSKVELDTGRAEAQRAIASVRAAQAQVTQAGAVLSSSQTNLAKATIYSPVTGVVLSRQIDPGQTVAASFQAPVLFTIAEDLAQMKLEVKVDEADVGQVKDGQRATFTVDAYPGRTFPAMIQRVDVGANASGTGSTSTATASTGTVIAYTAVLTVDNSDLSLRPGMTATAEIVTSERNDVLLVPNAALRYSPEREAAAASSQAGGITSVLAPPRGRRGAGGRGNREASIGRGSRQTVYVLGADGQPQAVRIVVGESDGSRTEVTGGDLKAGARVITGRLAAGQTQADADAGADKNGRGERGARGERGGQGKAAPEASAAEGEGRGRQSIAPPAAAPPAATPSAQEAPAAGDPPPPPQTAPAQPSRLPRPQVRGGPEPLDDGGSPRMRDMSPQERRAYLESLPPEQRQAIEERQARRRAAREAGREQAAPDDGR